MTLKSLNEKKYDYKTVIECGKRCQNIFIWVKKKTCLGVLERGDRENDDETNLKVVGGIEMSTTVLPLRDAPLSFALK